MNTVTTRLIAAAASLAVTAMIVPAAANAAPKAADGEATATSEQPATPKTESRRYCIETTTTGSRLSRRQCKPLSEWMARGVDPRATK